MTDTGLKIWFVFTFDFITKRMLALKLAKNLTELGQLCCSSLFESNSNHELKMC